MDYKELVNKAKRGDKAAFTELVAAKKDALYRIAYSYARNRDDALDIVSDTVYKAYVSINKLKEPSHFSTWLTRILINSALDHLRLNKRVLVTDQELLRENAEPRNREALLDLYQAIDALNEKERAVVILKYLEDMTLEQVALVLHCPIGTVKTYLHRALKELRLELKEDVI